MSGSEKTDIILAGCSIAIMIFGILGMYFNKSDKGNTSYVVSFILMLLPIIVILISSILYAILQGIGINIFLGTAFFVVLCIILSFMFWRKRFK